eukprot:4334967-Amphidinium_carterae.1
MPMDLNAVGKQQRGGKGKDKGGKDRPMCTVCHKPGHTKEQCWWAQERTSNRPNKDKGKGKGKGGGQKGKGDTGQSQTPSGKSLDK